MTDKQRADFEKAYLEKYPWRRGRLITRDVDGVYIFTEIEQAYFGYQLALKSLPVEAIQTGIDCIQSCADRERRDAVAWEKTNDHLTAAGCTHAAHSLDQQSATLRSLLPTAEEGRGSDEG